METNETQPLDLVDNYHFCPVCGTKMQHVTTFPEPFEEFGGWLCPDELCGYFEIE